ncbi:MAG: sugar isomerase family protein [Verrucomicrobia bacterium]|nr:sugar isomerase family protein [Verrucomicrobiota bacterium]
MSYSVQHLQEAAQILAKIDASACERCVRELADLRARGGRLFVLGMGGGAANASHAVSDFRKIAGIEAYAPTENVAELTARINDDGWEGAIAEWLRGSRIDATDALLVFSVGGGSVEKNISANLVAAMKLAADVGARIVAVVGQAGGHAAKVADACVLVPVANPANVTPHTEAFQAVLWHLFVSHPDLKRNPTKWESVTAAR